MVLLSVDPGPETSAYVLYDGTIQVNEDIPNASLLENIDTGFAGANPDRCVIEKVVSYGMGVGESTFETVYWSGIFAHAFGLERVDRIPRLDVKLHICHDSRAKDANIRMALMDRFGGPQSARKGGPLYKVGQHERAALALAITWWEKRYGPSEKAQAELGTVRQLLESLPADDHLGRISLEARRDKLLAEAKP